MNRKKLMLLGGVRHLVPVIETAHSLGVSVITADYLPDNVAHRHSDEYVNVNITDRETVLKVAQEKKIDGILSFGVDPGVITAAYVAEKMGLPSPPLASVEILQNKDRFRDFLAANGFNCPWHRSFGKDDKVMDFFHCPPSPLITTSLFPCMVKPVDSSGSKGCSRVDKVTELPRAVACARAESRSGHIIIEQFLEKIGHSSDTDSFSVNGDLVFCSFNCQYFDSSAANPLTPAGYTWPSDMPPEIQTELRSEIQRLIRLLNLGTSLYNIETRFCTDGKPYIMEFTPRGGGNRLSEILNLATGHDLIKNAVLGALGLLNGETGAESRRQYDGAWAEVIVHANTRGKYAGIEMAPAIRPHLVQEDIWISLGDRLEEFTGANKAIGTLILRFDTQTDAERALDAVTNWLKVMIV